MPLPNTLDELNVKLFKLLSGESIISYVHDLESDYHVGLEEPMSVSVDSKHQYVLTPWVPFSTGHVHILDNVNIILDSPVDNTMKAYYMKLVLDQITDEDIDSETTLH